MGPQNRRDGMHSDAMIKVFRALLENRKDVTHRTTIYNSTWKFLKHKSRNNTYISDEQLHKMELFIYHGIKVQVEDFEGERISQICQCTGSKSWRGGDRQNDCVRAKQCPGRWYGALNGHLLWQLQ